MRDSALKSLSTTMAKQNLGPLFLPSKFENFVFMLHLLFLLLLPVLFLSFKFHTYTLLSSHSLCLCKNPLSSMTFSYVVPFTLTKSWILFLYHPSLSEFSLFHSVLCPQIHFMAVTLDFCSFPVHAPPWLHPFYSFSIVSSVKYDPSHFPLSFSFSLLFIFSLVLWFQLKALFYFHSIPCKSLPIHLSPWVKSPMSPFCVHSSFSSAYAEAYSLAPIFISHILESLTLCSSLLNNDHIPCTLIFEVIFSLKPCQSIFPQFPDQ